MNALPYLTVELEIPSAKLTKNARVHYMEKARITAAHRLYAKAHFRKARGKLATRFETSVRATFFWKDKRRRDRGNAMSRLEPYWDGMQDAWVIADDVGLTFLPCVFEYSRPKKPCVVIECYDVEGEEA